jgi:tetratricopeptide (TPR) repeat protein
MKHKWIMLGLSALLIVGATVTPAISKSQDKADRQFESISRLLEKADQLREAGNGKDAGALYGAAIAAYEEFQRTFPDAWVEMTQFRTAYCRNQLMNILAAERAPALKSQAPPPVAPPPSLPPEIAKRLSIGIELCRAERYDEAEKEMHALIETHPECSSAYLVLGTACIGKGNLAAATTLIKRAILLDPKNKEAHYTLCQLLIRAVEPNFDSARNHYREAIRLGGLPDANLAAVLGLD